MPDETITADWRLTADSLRRETVELPPPAMAALSHPKGYVPNPAAVEAMNVAIALGQPLLITGEPGCGKTEFADWVAWKLGQELSLKADEKPEFALHFSVKSTTTADDLFYEVDAIERFHAAQQETDVDPRLFIRYQALGKAILWTMEKEEATARAGDRNLDHPGTPRRSVVLLDEIDKAPVEVPNDLLDELENLRFSVPALDETFRANRDYPPIVLMTSNNLKALPDPFLRRCIYFHMDYPDKEELRRILVSRITGFGNDSLLIGDLVALFGVLMKNRDRLARLPGTSELLGFILALKAAGAGPGDRLTRLSDWRATAIMTLAKKEQDRKVLGEQLDLFHKQNAGA